MRDIDELLEDGGFAGDVTADVRTAPFDPVREAGLKRARRRQGLTAGTTALAVCAVVGGVWLGVGSADDSGAPAGTPVYSATAPAAGPTDEPTPTAERPPDDGRPLAQEPGWFEGEDSYLSEFAFAPGEKVVAGIWTCARACKGLKQVLVVKSGAVRSMFAIRLRGTVVAAGEGRFVFAPYAPAAEPRLFDVGGEIPLRAVPEAPLDETDILVQINGSGLPIVGLQAVDAVSATSHPVPMPEGDTLRTVWADGRSLTVEGEQAVWTSDDGGIGWTRNDADRSGLLTAFVPSALPGTRVMLLGGDGATLFPVQRVVRLFADGRSSAREVDLESPFYLAGMVRPNGELVMALVAGEHGDRPQIFVGDLDGNDLREIEPVGFADAVDVRTLNSPDGLLLMANTADRDRVLLSSDGEVWKSVATR